VEVGEHGDTAAVQDLVGLGRGGRIGRLQHDPRAHLGRVRLGNDAAERGRHQHVHVE
jgi:hypothetical protein